MLVVSTVSMTSTISTQPASNFFFINYRPHHTWFVSIAAYLSNIYSPLPLTKVPPRHHTSVYPIPLIKCQHQPSFFWYPMTLGSIGQTPWSNSSWLSMTAPLSDLSLYSCIFLFQYFAIFAILFSCF